MTIIIKADSVRVLTAKSLQSRSTLCDPMDCSPPGSSVHGVLQTRILEWTTCPLPGDLPNPGIKPESFPSPVLAGSFFITRATWEATADSHFVGNKPTQQCQAIILQLKIHTHTHTHTDWLYSKKGFKCFNWKRAFNPHNDSSRWGVFWVIPIFQMRKLRFSEVRSVIHGHVAETWWSQLSSSDWLLPEAKLVTAIWWHSMLI